MKLRFDKNSVRFRVKKSDLEKLREQNFAEEKIIFPCGEFVYRLAVKKHFKEISAEAKQSSIEVNLPHDIVHEWMKNDNVGIYHTIYFSDSSLDILVEKDFPCKENDSEDKADAFTELAEKNNNKSC